MLHGDAYFPQLGEAGAQLAQVFVSSAGRGAESMQLMYHSRSTLDPPLGLVLRASLKRRECRIGLATKREK